MRLLGKRTGAKELGDTVKSLGTGAIAALTAKGSGQDPSTQSGGFTEGGEAPGGAGGGPTKMDRLSAFFKGASSNGLMDYYGNQSMVDQRSAMAELASERAKGLEEEREAKSKQWDFLGAANKIDASGGLGNSLEQFFNISGANKDGGVMTLMEVDNANKNIPGWNQEIADRVMNLSINPLTTMITNNTQRIEQIMLKDGQLGANGKVDIKMLDHPDVAAQLPKAAEAYKMLKNQKETLKLANGVYNDFIRRQGFISPPSMESQKANAIEGQVAGMMKTHPEINRQQAYAILLPDSKRTLETAWIELMGYEGMPMDLGHWEQIKPHVWEQVASKISKDEGLDSQTLRTAWQEMLQKTYNKNHGGYKGSGNRAAWNEETLALKKQLSAPLTKGQEADAILNNYYESEKGTQA